MGIMQLLPAVEGGSQKQRGSRSWALENGRATASIDGEAAVRQAIRLALELPRYRYLIYSWQYGSELETLIGQDFDRLCQLAPEMIRGALLQDDRIEDVRDFTFQKCSDGAEIGFSVETTTGTLREKIPV